MSRFSVKEGRANKLEEALLEQLEQTAEERDELTEEEIGELAPEEFETVPYNAERAERIGYSNYSYWRSTLRMFLKNRLAVAMLIAIVLLMGFAIIQPYLPGQGTRGLTEGVLPAQGPKNAIRIYNWPVGTKDAGMPMKNQRPSGEFWFGTNAIGQDLWSMIWSGTRTSLIIGFAVALIEAVVGTFTGLLWGYIRKLDFFFTELYNVLNNIPTTIVLILCTYVMRASIPTLILAMSLTGWMGLARFIRNQVLMIRDRDFNLASRCLGTPTDRIIVKNLIPQMVSVIMLRMALAVPGAIGWEVFLSYIGLGLSVDTPSLGNLVNTGRAMISAPRLRYQLVFPAVILSVITICFYLVGNAFADAADPRNHL